MCRHVRVLFWGTVVCCLPGICGGDHCLAGVEIRVVGIGGEVARGPSSCCCCRPQCAAAEVLRNLKSRGQRACNAVATGNHIAQDAGRPVAHLIPGLGGLYECACVCAGARHKFEQAVVRDVTRRWQSGQMMGTAEGLTYLSLGAGGLFPDLLVLPYVFV